MARLAQSSLLIVIVSICLVLSAGVAILLYLNGNSPPPPQASTTASEPVQTLDQTAEERAYEAIRSVQTPTESSETDKVDARDETKAGITRRQSPDSAGQGAQQGALPPTTLALNCERLRKAYRSDELEEIPGFKEKCRQ